MKKIISSILFAVLLTSCDGSQSKKLQAENEALRVEVNNMQSDFEEMLSTLNGIEDGFQQIKDAENYLSVQAYSNDDISSSERDRLANDMAMIQEILQKNREKIAQLEKDAKNNNYKSSQLQATLTRLSREIEEKSQLVIALQGELSQRDQRIARLSDSILSMSSDIDKLSDVNDSHKETIKEKDNLLNKAFYVFGTKKELKDQDIVRGTGLFGGKTVLGKDFNKEYFTQIDKRNFSELPLFAPEAKMISDMPADSYEFVKEANGDLTLVITDHKKFWSMTNYLVILVDL